MPPKSNVPIRIGGSKVRTGCATCKRRHLKCDERRPACSRCQRANLDCTYQDPLLQQQRQTPPIRTPSPYGSRDVIEVRAMRSFADILGPELAGGFSTRVWRDFLPRAAQHEPIIWDAITAIDMLNESIRLRVDETPAVRQYSKSIRGLNDRLQSAQGDGQTNRDVVLLSALLFAVFECLQNRAMNALTHIRGGLKLLAQWESDGSEQSGRGYIDRAMLKPVFLSLDSQAIQLGVPDASDFPNTGAPSSPGDHHFESTEAAAEAISLIFHRISRWAQSIEAEEDILAGDRDPSTLEAQYRLRTEIENWDHAASHLFGQRVAQPTTLLLRFQRLVLELFFCKHAERSGSIAWDRYNPQFREAVECAEAYMQATANDDNQSGGGRTVFTVALDIVMSLFLIASKCREPVIRRRALALLKTCGRREGIWDSAGCAVVCEKLIEAEEAAASEDGEIGEGARIYEIDLKLDEEKVTDVVYKTLEGEIRLEESCLADAQHIAHGRAAT